MNDKLKEAIKMLKLYSDQFVAFSNKSDYKTGKMYADIMCFCISKQSEEFIQGIMDRMSDGL